MYNFFVVSFCIMETINNEENQIEDKHAFAGKVLLWCLGLIIIASVGFNYWRIVVAKNYLIEAEMDCDPMVEKCFIYTCDPQTETTCTGNPEEDVWYFQKIQRTAANIPLCDPADENCKALVCPEGEKDCKISFCDEQTKLEGEVCNDPVEYAIDNPVEEESVCAEDDQECLAAQEEVQQGDVAADCDPASEDCAKTGEGAANENVTVCDPATEGCVVSVDAQKESANASVLDASKKEVKQ